MLLQLAGGALCLLCVARLLCPPAGPACQALLVLPAPEDAALPCGCGCSVIACVVVWYGVGLQGSYALVFLCFFTTWMIGIGE